MELLPLPLVDEFPQLVRAYPVLGLVTLLPLVRQWCVQRQAKILGVKRQRRLRRLVPDRELIRRKAADEPLRQLALDYDVSHTTLGRFFKRPEVAKELKQAFDNDLLEQVQPPPL